MEDRAKVYILSPFGKTHTIRNLIKKITLSNFKTVLELSTGFPDGTYSLKFGNKVIPDTEIVLFSKGLVSGATLRISERPELQAVVNAVKLQEFDAIRSACRQEDGQSTDVSKAFIAACVCTNLGLKAITAQLINHGKFLRMQYGQCGQKNIQSDDGDNLLSIVWLL